MQAYLVNNSLPSSRVVSFRTGGVPNEIIVVLVSAGSVNRGENVLRYSTTAQRSSSLRLCFQGGMGVPGMPSETALNRSTSVGNCPVGVERSLNLASTKLRGLGNKNAAASPLPSPFNPWQAAQFWAYTTFPCSMNCGVTSGFGGAARSEK